jgi:hypothetical protein
MLRRVTTTRAFLLQGAISGTVTSEYRFRVVGSFLTATTHRRFWEATNQNSGHLKAYEGN